MPGRAGCARCPGGRGLTSRTTIYFTTVDKSNQITLSASAYLVRVLSSERRGAKREEAACAGRGGVEGCKWPPCAGAVSPASSRWSLGASQKKLRCEITAQAGCLVRRDAARHHWSAPLLLTRRCLTGSNARLDESFVLLPPALNSRAGGGAAVAAHQSGPERPLASLSLGARAAQQPDAAQQPAVRPHDSPRCVR